MDKSTEKKLARYQQLRATGKNLHDTLLDRLPKNALKECGKILGIYHRGTFVLNSEYEMSVLMDYCIYDYRWGGQNVVERYVARASIEPNSDESILLDAMLQARYSLFAIDEIVTGVGIQTHDLLKGDSIFIIDIALSETVVEGFILAGRIITPDNGEFSMTTGALLPVDAAVLKRFAKEIPERFGEEADDIDKMSPEKAAKLSGFIIRTLFESDASSRISHECSGMSHEADTRHEVAEAKPKVGRNDPCPCGSGKKFKKCCGGSH
ncbi:SEC-C metal-binding domain-containing protein [Dehalococcoidia bacterium]|nr:SEC-C metal-binding domain-containing protein [Dehalococcoidia bacterium]MCL0050929.1 SEC-C metal-binding domain-containing protein [Dehalococcoidia bacterium]MCL0075304.1 SEC-C metal-binding domain-containing protein [Dehalococcoidia bacterium]MCL0078761.1 SEC-C metal-binding domain-containing protein [Dehalococcoidia bacterium]MCL0090099.1 SEC-C metal-binding domain-containing protein [Dehalococcoidia bacterium]